MGTSSVGRCVVHARSPLLYSSGCSSTATPMPMRCRLKGPYAGELQAVGSPYGFARLWLSGRCPPPGNDGTIPGITRQCYLRELRLLEEELRPRPLPPPESPDDKARREVLKILMQSTMQVYPWPEVIRNPVIKSRLRLDRAPR